MATLVLYTLYTMAGQGQFGRWSFITPGWWDPNDLSKSWNRGGAGGAARGGFRTLVNKRKLKVFRDEYRGGGLMNDGFMQSTIAYFLFFPLGMVRFVASLASLLISQAFIMYVANPFCCIYSMWLHCGMHIHLYKGHPVTLLHQVQKSAHPLN